MGHHDVGDDVGANNFEAAYNDIRNESYESILPNDTFANEDTNINFDAGEKVKVCVSFENSVFGIDVVRTFVTESPVHG
jgi:hypothetical protein